MKGHKLFNKAVAGALTLALALGIAPAAVGVGIEAYADTATPSVSVYATKAQLTDDTFTPKLNDEKTAVTADNKIGKIKFGGKAWYLLGGDGTNADIFAAEKIISDSVFQTGASADWIPDADLWSSVTYTNGDKPTTVYSNNYGASKLRSNMQDLAADDYHFNTVEQGMMNAKTVTTTDFKNKTTDGANQLTYTTSDKLYVPASANEMYGDISIDVAGKLLPRTTYWSGGGFWLRTGFMYYYVSLDARDNGVGSSVVTATLDVKPAANLDFSSVLFASAAPAQSSEATKTVIDSDVMNLRLAATDSTAVTKDALGSVSVDANSGEVTATKGTAASVTLVVQGNDGANDWYYAKAFTDETVTVNADDIATDLDLTNCKVWLEASDANGNIYATEPTTECNVTFMNNNGTPDSLQVVEAGSKLTAPSITKAGYKLEGWYQNDDFTGEAWNFDEDTVTGDMTLYAKWVKADKDNDKGGSDNDKGGSDSDNAGSGSDNNGSSSNGAAGSDSDTSDSSAGTGDDTNVLGLLALLTLAGAGAGTVFIRRRHN